LTRGAQIDDNTARACVHAALDQGITTFDSANVYAQVAAESTLGAAIKGMRRESLEVCTKVYFPVGDGPNDRGLGRKHILESIDGSLRRLGTEYVDLYQAHRFDPTVSLEETMPTFADIVRSGKARELRIPLVSNQPQYSMLWRVIEPDVVPTCQRLGIGQIAFSPLAQEC
jgi:aryl-alcohol dehydrogenase-like predicted oxidoreductase